MSIPDGPGVARHDAAHPIPGRDSVNEPARVNLERGDAVQGAFRHPEDLDVGFGKRRCVQRVVT